MFQNPQTLDKSQHDKLRFTPAKDFAFARSLTTAPLAPIEIVEAGKFYPVLFSIENPVTPVAVLGLRERNVFLNDHNQWGDTYVPVHVRRYPFILAKVENEDRYLLAADLAAPQLASPEGEPLFAEGAEMNPYFDQVLELLNRFETNSVLGRAVFAELETSGVLDAKNLSFQEGDETHLIGGFRTVDKDKVNALDDATLARWVRNGLMSILEVHWASLQHLKTVALASSRPEQLQ